MTLNSSQKLAALLLGVFLLFSLLVGLKIFSVLDVKTTVFFQTVIPHTLDYPFSFLSLIGSFEVTFVILVAVLLVSFRAKLKHAVPIVALFVVGTLVELTGKFFLFHPSPPQLFFRNVGLIFPTTYVHTNYSYPSGHMFRVTFLIILIYYCYSKKKLKILITTLLFLFLGLMIASRIYLGEHWLTDVIGGMLLGSATVIFALNLSRTK